MNNVIAVNKPVGYTPLQTLDKLRENYPEIRDQKLTYAGRLDPMASGLMLVLVGEECKNAHAYKHLDKTYEAKIIFGLNTDTYDALGLLASAKLQIIPKDFESKLNQIVTKLPGTISQQYPPFSYLKTGGKPLWHYAREGKIADIKIPTKTITIYGAHISDLQTIPIGKIVTDIKKKIKLVDGDFRQKEILAHWNKFQKSNSNSLITTAKITIDCSSGTYIRSIAHDIGKQLFVGAIAHDIYRTSVGFTNVREAVNIV